MSMNMRGKDIEALKMLWRARYGTDAPMATRPTPAELDCSCAGKPDGCKRVHCPRKKG